MPTDLVYCSFTTEILTPFCIVKGFALDERNKPLRFDIAKMFREDPDAFYFYFSVGKHSR